MDLGATICTPKRPSCLVCPLQSLCKANATGIADLLPRRTAKPVRPVRSTVAFIALREDGALLLRRRPDQGLLARMMEVPSTPWTEMDIGIDEALRSAPVRGDWWAVPGLVIHTFTHFRLDIQVVRAIVSVESELTLWAGQERCIWVPRRELRNHALPSVITKVIAHGLKEN
jgi:A/G-specific adenine glycosylase